MLELAVCGSQSERAYAQIRREILSCRVLPGARLPVKELCETLGYSSGAVREALSRLAAEGLVALRSQYGFRAAEISAEQLRDLTRARFEIERICLRMSLEHGDLEWEVALISAAHRLQGINRIGRDRALNDDWSAAHGEFHRALAAGCPIQTLLAYRQQLWELSERYRRLAVPLSEDTRDLGEEHRSLLEASLARDADKAITFAAQHLENTMMTLLDWIESREAVNTVEASKSGSAKPQLGVPPRESWRDRI